MQQTHTPLSTWFLGAYLVTTQTPGQSALQFQRQLGLTRYETAFQILHKLRAGMVRPERDRIGGEHPVEVDECLVGGRTRARAGACITARLSSERLKCDGAGMPRIAPPDTASRMKAACRSSALFTLGDFGSALSPAVLLKTLPRLSPTAYRPEPW